MSTDAQTARRRALAAIEMARFEEARSQAQKAIAADPTHPDGHALLSRAYINLQDAKGALEAAEAGLRVAPENEWLHRLRALSLAEQGRGNEALAAAKEAVRLSPDEALPHKALGMVLERLGRIPQAKAAMEQSLELDPEDASTHRRYGDLFLGSDPATAERHYLASLRLDPHSSVTLNNLGVALEQLGRKDEALDAYHAAVLADPKNVRARQNAHLRLSERFGMRTWALGGCGVVLLLLHLARLVGKGGLVLAGLVLTLVGLALGGTWAVRWAARRRRLRALSRSDPELYRLFMQLESDRKSGRL